METEEIDAEIMCLRKRIKELELKKAQMSQEEIADEKHETNKKQ